MLDPRYSAHVVALSARIHAVISGSEVSVPYTTITCTSLQFKAGQWSYQYALEEKSTTALKGKNPFIEAVVTAVLAYACPDFPSNLSITIFSDDGYHSQEDDPVPLVGKRLFHSHSKPITQVPKTGLGSSAALTVAVTAALLSYYRPTLSVTDTKDLQLIHNLAQLAHCTAQGKVGSGFDVASAVFGSVVYRRFPAELLGDLTAEVTDTAKVTTVVESRWDMQITRCALPDGLSLLMGDVKGGSATPSMVKTVLAWRKNNPERAGQVWTALDEANMALVGTLTSLSSSHKSPELLEQLRNNFLSIRKYLKIMTRESGAAIEPGSQTRLLDACYKLDGVYGGCVPGAGGYDAIALVVDSTKIEDIKRISRADPVLSCISWLQLKEQTVGLQTELPDSYPLNY